MAHAVPRRHESTTAQRVGDEQRTAMEQGLPHGPEAAQPAPAAGSHSPPRLGPRRQGRPSQAGQSLAVLVIGTPAPVLTSQSRTARRPPLPAGDVLTSKRPPFHPRANRGMKPSPAFRTLRANRKQASPRPRRSIPASPPSFPRPFLRRPMDSRRHTLSDPPNTALANRSLALGRPRRRLSRLPCGAGQSRSFA